ncbi:2'-5' RNA ligase family protein [Streptomyces sp. NPDC059631]|uniref:2'-5' RNA ligase family protein n=1 Tax=unclassified Streptomyces TaxID=2593676 RepID=UPI003677F860
MQRFVPHFRVAPWADGQRVLHVYLLPDLAVDRELDRLAGACHAAMEPYPIALLEGGRLHATVEMVADTTADRITAAEREDLVEALRTHLADVTPFQVTAGSPIANKAGALLDLSPDEPLLDLRGHVQDALVEARGRDVLQHDGGRHHMSLGYAYDTADGDPLQSALRKITPSHVPFRVTHAHLLDVTFHERPRDGGMTAWEISWSPVAAIPLGAA